MGQFKIGQDEVPGNGYNLSPSWANWNVVPLFKPQI